MSSRILTIENKGKLTLKNNQLVFTSHEGIKKTVAIEDLECVIIESREIVITHSLLSKSLYMRNELKKVFTYQVKLDDNWVGIISSFRLLCNSLIRSFDDKKEDLLFIPRDWKK